MSITIEITEMMMTMMMADDDNDNSTSDSRRCTVAEDALRCHDNAG